MKLFLNINDLKLKYINYGNFILDRIQNKYEKIAPEIKLKVEHGLSMCDSVGETTIHSGLFNESYKESGQIDGLLHDIGRFEQYLRAGTLKDYEASEIIGYADHGKFGGAMLEADNYALIRCFMPNNPLYDYVLKEVVKEHTNITNSRYGYELIDLKNIFQNYELSEILSSNNDKLIDKLITLKLKVLRENDSLEILQKVKDGLWKPAIGSKEKYHIKDEVWDIFTNFGFLNMAELKAQGLWTCNAGFLLRYSLLYQNINFVCTLKTLLEDKTIELVLKNQLSNVTNDNNEYVTDDNLIDKKLKEAYDYIMLVVDNLIKTSPDGIIITPKSREEAKERVLKIYNS